jgi:hypothetical protein
VGFHSKASKIAFSKILEKSIPHHRHEMGKREKTARAVKMADRWLLMLILPMLLAICIRLFLETTDRCTYFYKKRSRENNGNGYEMGEETLRPEMNSLSRVAILLSLYPCFADVRRMRRKSKHSEKCQRPASAMLITSLVILLANDIELNPGPAKYPCIECSKAVRSNQQGILCDGCELWCHRKCTDTSKTEYDRLDVSDDPWHCRACRQDTVHPSPDESNPGNPPAFTPAPDDTEDFFKELTDIRCKAAENPIFAFMNINSIRYKHCEIEPALSGGLLDFLAVADRNETGQLVPRRPIHHR